PAQVVGAVRSQGRVAPDQAAAAFAPPLLLHQVGGLACGDDHQEGPQVVPVRQLWETAALRAAAETVERTEGHVFLLAHAPTSSSSATRRGVSRSLRRASATSRRK